MEFIKSNGLYIIRLALGEEVITALSQWVTENHIPGGSIAGIGAIRNTTLGYYQAHHKTYLKKTFAAEMELVSFIGNISYFEGIPVIHAHVSIANSEYETFSGHLFSAEIAVTGEFFVWPLERKLSRLLDKSFDLNLLQLFKPALK